MKLTGQDIYDICESIVHNIENFAENYNTFEHVLTFEDYILTRTCVLLQSKYNKYDIQEAFEDYRIKAIIDFYKIGEENDEQENQIH